MEDCTGPRGHAHAHRETACPVALTSGRTLDPSMGCHSVKQLDAVQRFQRRRLPTESGEAYRVRLEGP